jgi:uncharacterized membrane protein
LDTNSPIEPGDRLRVDYNIENTGDEYGRQDVELFVEGDREDSDSLGLDEGESDSGTLTWRSSSWDSGRFDIEVRTEDDSESDTIRVREDEEELKAEFDYNPDNPEAGESVRFDASDSEGDIEEHSWDFDDGSTGSGETERHTFDSEGYYYVDLEVEADDGRTDERTRTVYVGERDDQTYDLTVNVEDESRNSIRSAEVEVDSRTRYTDITGEAFFTNLEEDYYDVEVSKSGYTTETRNVDLDGDRTITVRLQDDTDLEADFDYTPNNPDVDEEVEFDASDSTGDIVDYSWEFEGHGTSSGREVSQAFDSSGYFDVTLTVEDSNGDIDSYTRTIYIGRGEGLNADFDYRPINPRVDEEVRFDASDSSGDVEEYRWEFEDHGTERGEVVRQAFDDSGFFDIELTVEDDNGNTDSYSRVIYIEGDDEGEEEFDLDVTVEDSETDDAIENARVSVDGATRETDDDGEVDFRLEESVYDIFVSADDYYSEYRTVTLDEDRDIEIELDRRTDRRPDIRIDSIDIPASACRGDSLEAEVELSNYGNIDEGFTLEVDGLGSSLEKNYYLDEDEEMTAEVELINAEGSGNEEVEFRVGGESVSKTVRVRDCEGEDKRVSVKATPTQIRIGDSIRVSGYVDNAERGTQVNILVGGDRAGSATTNPDGYYETYIVPEDAGKQTVRAGVSGGSAATRIDVLPTAAVISAETRPNRVFEGESFEVCAEVESQATPLVVLKENGQEVDSVYDRGEVCFERRKAPGNYDYTVEAWARGQSSSQSASVEVMEMDSEVRNFPDQIASVRSGSGMVKVELYNNHKELKDYQISLEGLPDTWTSQSRKEVMLRSGERSTEYIFFNPKQEGDFRATLRVSSQGQTIYTEDIDISSGGRNRPPSLINRVIDAIVFW